MYSIFQLLFEVSCRYVFQVNMKQCSDEVLLKMYFLSKKENSDVSNDSSIICILFMVVHKYI